MNTDNADRKVAAAASVAAQNCGRRRTKRITCEQTEPGMLQHNH